MNDRTRPSVGAFSVGFALLTLLGGCTAAVGARPTAPVPLTDAEIAVVAELMRAEDARVAEVQPVLLAAEDPSPAVRARAALALGRLRTAGAREQLLRLLEDADTSVAANAAFALGQLGDSTAAAPLAAVLSGADPSRPGVAAEAAYALGKIPGTAAARYLSEFLQARDLRTGPATEPVASALLATWRHPRPDDVAFITRWTASPDPELRWRAGYALVRRPTPAAAAILLPLIADPDPRVRAMAIRGVTFPLADSAGIGAAALPALIAAVRDDDYAVRINAVRALGTYAQPSAVEALIQALRGDDRHLAITAAESLGRLASAAAEAAAPLREFALDVGRPPFLRQTALESLARVQPTGARHVAEQLVTDPQWRVRIGAARALAAPAAGATQRVERLLRDGDSRVAAAALTALIASAGDSLAPLRSILVESVAAEDVGVRTAAISALGRLADPSTFPLLLDAYQRALADADNDARLAAVDAIAAFERTGASPARAFFARFSRSPDYLVRMRVQQRFGAAATAWGAPLPLEPRPTAYADLVRHYQQSGARPLVRLETEQGTIDLLLYGADAPLTVANFLALARDGYFDGQEWPRVVPNFVVQGGDPRGDTSGGPGYSIRDEFNRHRYGTGTLGMALSGPDTGGSQWFITHSPQPHLDGAYTVFGEVVTGQEVTERILPGDRIHRIHVLP